MSIGLGKGLSRKTVRLLPLLVAGAMMLSACGGGEPTATTVPATATTGAGVTATDTTTSASTDMTSTPTTGGATATDTTTAMGNATPTESAAMGTPTVATVGTGSTEIAYPQGSANLTLWHGYTGAEADTLNAAIKDLESKNPNFKVNVLAIPFDQLQNKFTTEASTGGGPDLLIGPNDWIGPLADANLIADLSSNDMAKTLTGQLTQSAVQGATYNGKLIGIPTSTKNVALYYNKSLVTTLPKDTDDLINMSGSLVGGNVQYGLALNLGFYQQVGYNFAFGGKLFTDNSGKTVDFTTPGSIAWLNWLAKAKAAKGVFAKSGADQDIDNLFKNGQAAMVINGPWALGDYQKALGVDKVGVATAPPTPQGGKFAPFVGTENYFVSANTKDANNAVAFINYIASPGVATQFVKVGQISTNTRVDLSINPALQAFSQQAKDGTPFPSFASMAQVWTPAGDMITKVTDGKATADQAAKDATDAINKAIASQK